MNMMVIHLGDCDIKHFFSCFAVVFGQTRTCIPQGTRSSAVQEFRNQFYHSTTIFEISSFENWEQCFLDDKLVFVSFSVHSGR